MSPKEPLLWSIALPGLGQFLNRKYVKALTLVVLEFLINVQANFNQVIMLSFQGRIDEAIQTANYQWLMFYPCMYLFSAWDAYRDAGGPKNAYDFLPFVFGAYFVTVGLMYSNQLRLFGVMFGPLWLPMLALLPGVLTGLAIRKIAISLRRNPKGPQPT